jgi:hypothetical protein
MGAVPWGPATISLFTAALLTLPVPPTEHATRHHGNSEVRLDSLSLGWSRTCWNARPRPDSSIAAVRWLFREDSTYECITASDYISVERGIWHAETPPTRHGLLLLAGIEGSVPHRIVCRVLCVRPEVHGISLGHTSYHPATCPTDVNTTRLDITPAITRCDSATRQVILALASQSWMADRPQTSYLPDTISFNNVGSFSASFAAPKCRTNGTWDLVVRGTTSVELTLGIVKEGCFPQSVRSPALVILPVIVTDSTLQLSQVRYHSIRRTSP